MGQHFDAGYMIRSFPVLVGYVHITVFITLIAAILGIILGSIIAIVRIKKTLVISQLLRIFISFVRGTPFLVQLFLVYFGVPELLSHMGMNVRNVPPILFVLVVFTLYVAAYGAEIMRSSINAVAEGEKEAAASLGMTAIQSYTRVILPQAFALAIPPLINTVISVVKGTALIFNVGIVDIMRKADLMGGNSQRNLELFVDVAVIYGILIFVLTFTGRALEKRCTISSRSTQLQSSEE
ncbi:amino acid ABC transporter permease [Megasphaera cerevisiae DSM 20462]|uniref:Amino acid ABC transporter permease n=1 Tax=Megasphaera cerevisiae DSM 20462 TaxID=1122219 RepID=A0A0J6WWH1_9FIRM|nr:amino acid ABC transporter permease [Megasphaera cerevisiae]KMO86944.1 amino acid ABC transporter permease [Megasphaera cerevisiae DSM 20462]OKY54103.1 amino acid ABC transporter permease [Megasphaera cerevisiae]SJZ55872.1 amino acid ABC transporter membrane protein, PAAT family (TC 3.A.1.3.-) [Megasphaera cerevisiae DSM 20462]